eukprot:TRINITY_DN740_c0_g1_i2.p1 TRINITY_DN740_c0_g1~~TRINITY_DN740_c0_g1_i2.p1  ORF type:complete len:159 (-),score=26.32 TRINITY_DN740_c0_g1_i2:82-558(-)
MLLLNNNKITRIATGLAESLPNLDTIILANNKIANLGDLDPLSELTSLRVLSLMGNPVTKKTEYRLYIIHKLPKLKLLDFSKIKKAERELAHKRFGSANAPAVESSKDEESSTPVVNYGPTEAEKAAIRNAIKNAKSPEEIQRLDALLQQGQIPKSNQ